MGEKLNEFGMKPLTKKNYFVYGLGNFASQLSWTMVSTYLSIFYTDVFGLGTGAVALLMLIAKVWDGINDPMMGTIMERTHTKHGRFRPYIFVGAIFLVIFTILTFTVPGFGSTGKLIYAYITYIGLGMSYTMTNVPYLALPVVMTRDPKEVNKLNAAQMMGMTIGQIILNLFVLKLVLWFGKGDQAAGYHSTAILSMIIQGGALIVLFVGPYENIVFDFIVLIVYGLGYVAGPCGAGMMVDAIDDFDDKYEARNDGMAFSFQGCAIKIATAIANSLFLVVMGAFGYAGGVDMTPHIQTGINIAANLLPGIVFFVGIIPLLIYDLDKPGHMEAVRERLAKRDAAKKAATN